MTVRTPLVVVNGQVAQLPSGDTISGASEGGGSMSQVASASTLTLPQVTLVKVSGSTQINTIATSGWTAGTNVTLLFSGSPLVKTTAAVLAGNCDYQAATNSILGLIFDGVLWHETLRKMT